MKFSQFTNKFFLHFNTKRNKIFKLDEKLQKFEFKAVLSLLAIMPEAVMMRVTHVAVNSGIIEATVALCRTVSYDTIDTLNWDDVSSG